MTNEQLITLTPKVIAHIERGIKTAGEGSCFRLSIKKTGCTGWMYKPEIVAEPTVGDIEVPLLTSFKIFLDPNCLEALQGTVVDLEEKGLGFTQMVFNNPNVASLCGCGESFNVKSK
jgi:iron-sulfur cluster assembly accessory protein